MVTQCALRVATRMAAWETGAKASFGGGAGKAPWGRGWSGRSLRELTYFRLSATDGKTSAPSSYILSIVFVTNFFSFSFFWDTNSEKFDHGVNRRFLIKIDVIFFHLSVPEEQEVSLFKRDISSHTVARVRRQVLAIGQSNQVQGLTVRQECDGILLEWKSLQLPYRYNLTFWL